jgi:hypothetical protein
VGDRKKEENAGRKCGKLVKIEGRSAWDTNGRIDLVAFWVMGGFGGALKVEQSTSNQKSRTFSPSCFPISKLEGKLRIR